MTLSCILLLVEVLDKHSHSHTYTHTYTHTHIYIYIYIYLSSPSWRDPTMDFPDSLSPFVFVIQNLHIRLKESLDGRRYFDSFRDGWKLAAQLLLCRMFLPIWFVVFLCHSRLAFSLYTLSASLWCIHIVESTRLFLGKNRVFFYRIDLTSTWSLTYQYQCMHWLVAHWYHFL